MSTWKLMAGEQDLRIAAKASRLVLHISGAKRSAGQPAIELFSMGPPGQNQLLATFKSCQEAADWIQGDRDDQ